MANDLQTEREPSVTGLVTGIVSDIQDLLKQQLALFRHEVESDFNRSKEAMIAIMAGMGVALVGISFLLFMLVHLMHWGTDMPLWGCYGIVGGALAIVGGVMYFVGRRKFDSFNPLPDESAQAAKENLQCLMNPK